MATSPSVPAQPEAEQAVPFQFGTAVRACAGSTRTPGAFSLTWVDVRSHEEAGEVRLSAAAVA